MAICRWDVLVISTSTTDIRITNVFASPDFPAGRTPTHDLDWSTVGLVVRGWSYSATQYLLK